MPAQPVNMSAPEPVMNDADRQAGLILVELGPKQLNLYGDKDRTGIFHEFDYRHPNNGEAHVVAGRVTKVFPTPTVRLAEAHGMLKQVFDRPETSFVNIADSIQGNAQPATDQIAAKDLEIQRLRDKIARMKAAQAAEPEPEETDDEASEDETEEVTPEDTTPSGKASKAAKK